MYQRVWGIIRIVVTVSRSSHYSLLAAAGTTSLIVKVKTPLDTRCVGSVADQGNHPSRVCSRHDNRSMCAAEQQGLKHHIAADIDIPGC